MLYHSRTEVSEGIHVKNKNASKESIIFRYWYFSDKGYKFNHLPVMFVMMY